MKAPNHAAFSQSLETLDKIAQQERQRLNTRILVYLFEHFLGRKRRWEFPIPFNTGLPHHQGRQIFAFSRKGVFFLNSVFQLDFIGADYWYQVDFSEQERHEKPYCTPWSELPTETLLRLQGVLEAWHQPTPAPVEK